MEFDLKIFETEVATDTSFMHILTSYLFHNT